MLTFLLFILLIMDLVLIAGIFLYLKYNKNQAVVLESLTEERIAIKRIRTGFDEALTEGLQEMGKKLDEFRQLSAETERETKTARTQIREALDEVLIEFGSRLEEPLTELSRRQNSLEGTIKLSEKQKSILLEGIKKGEILAKFFHQEIPYDQLLKDIELKKYDDARKLLSRGLPGEQVARELGLRPAEVDLIQSLACS